MQSVLAGLQTGLQSKEHQAFVQQLAQRRTLNGVGSASLSFAATQLSQALPYKAYRKKSRFTRAAKDLVDLTRYGRLYHLNPTAALCLKPLWLRCQTLHQIEFSSIGTAVVYYIRTGA